MHIISPILLSTWKKWFYELTRYLLRSFDPGWRREVDGVDAALLRGVSGDVSRLRLEELLNLPRKEDSCSPSHICWICCFSSSSSPTKLDDPSNQILGILDWLPHVFQRLFTFLSHCSCVRILSVTVLICPATVLLNPFLSMYLMQ